MKDTTEDNIMIQTPYGKKRWWLIREALELYEKTGTYDYLAKAYEKKVGRA